ncbi:MAG: methyltransferase domain-containing protein [Betaproteobacteria bacterium]|nr:methyltransferase domain-containing protein [Betaproteobacteria bacterium]
MTADLDAAVKHYNALADSYDRATRLINKTRLAAIARLAPRAGEIVVDAGCGTGFCLGPLREAVGASGVVIGFEPAAAMLHVARQRVAAAGWDNVYLMETDASVVRLSHRADAWLFSYTHDLLQSRSALSHLLGQGKTGARVAATGSKLFTPWLWPGNLWVQWRHRRYITDPKSLAAPWLTLSEFLEDQRIDAAPFAQHYLATGRVRPGLTDTPG